MKKEKILEELYNAVKEEIKPSAETRQAESNFVEIREKFLKQIGVEHRRELEKVTDAVIEICTEQEKQFFFLGYKTAETLLINDKDKRGI